MLVKNITIDQWKLIFSEIEMLINVPLEYNIDNITLQWQREKAYRNIFSYVEITIPALQEYVKYSMIHNIKYLNAVLESINITFDPLTTQAIKTIYQGHDQNSGDNVILKTGNDTFNAGVSDTMQTAAFGSNTALTDSTKSVASGSDETVYNTTDKHTNNTRVDFEHNTTVSGYTDIITAAKAIYETKIINWYVELFKILDNALLTPTYDFSECDTEVIE